MGISMIVHTSGFRKWSEAHDPKIAVRAVAGEAAVISAPDLDQGMMTPVEQPHRPWLVPGAGTLKKNMAGQGFHSKHDFNGSESAAGFGFEPDLLCSGLRIVYRVRNEAIGK